MLEMRRSSPPRVPRTVAYEASRPFVSMDVTEGLPRHMTEDTFTIGGKEGPRQVRLVPPGLHPTTPETFAEQFIWSPERTALWTRFLSEARALRDQRCATHIAIGGSLGSTDWKNTGDMDAIAFFENSRKKDPQFKKGLLDPLVRRTVNQRHEPLKVMVYPSDMRFYESDPRTTPLWLFKFAPHQSRPAGTPRMRRGPEVGIPLLTMNDVVDYSESQGVTSIFYDR